MTHKFLRLSCGSKKRNHVHPQRKRLVWAFGPNPVWLIFLNESIYSCREYKLSLKILNMLTIRYFRIWTKTRTIILKCSWSLKTWKNFTYLLKHPRKKLKNDFQCSVSRSLNFDNCLENVISTMYQCTTKKT